MLITYIFLVDVSKSLKPDQFVHIRNALLQWAEKMGAKDRAAIVTFGESVKTVQDFTADKAVLKTKIGELALTDLHTRLTQLDLIDHNLEPFPLFAGDRLLLCSDGLYAALEEIEIAPLFDHEAQQTAEDLVALVLAKDRPSQDNLTAAILACESDSEPATKLSREIPPPKKYFGWLVGGA